MGRLRVACVVVLVASLACVLVAPAFAGAAADGAVPAATAAEPVVVTQEFEADRTEFRITVYENGSARWLFRYERRLADDSDRADFESFAEEFNTNDTDLYRNFRSRAVELTDAGTNATGREMAAEAFAREARVEELGPTGEEFGVVEMSFRWEAFAEPDGQRVVVGDVFEGGLYVGPDQRLVFAPGPNLAFQAVEPDPDSQAGETLADSATVTFEGDDEDGTQFADRRPRVVLTDPASAGGPTPTAAGPGGGTDPGEPTTDPGWLLPVGALAVVLLLGLGAAVAYRAGLLPADRLEPADGEVETETETEADDGGTEAEAAGGGTAVPEEELLSDEERVVRLLEDNGGRMKQVNIVDETGWSKSKVSMLLSDMEEEETISRLRVGRENIVSLSGHEPDAAGSPFDDE